MNCQDDSGSIEEEMTMNPIDTKRKRAWLLYEAEDLEDANTKANAIYSRFGTVGGDNFVVVRADVIINESEQVMILVPVDTSGEPALSKLVGDINTITTKPPVLTAKVKDHYPAITYLAHGFVSEEEFIKSDKRTVHPDLYGRIMRKSPGDNPWG
jgi:hypothetical protein